MYKDIDGFPQELNYEKIYSIFTETHSFFYENDATYKTAVNKEQAQRFDTKHARDLLIKELNIADTDFTRKYNTYILQLVHGALLTLAKSPLIDYSKWW